MVTFEPLIILDERERGKIREEFFKMKANIQIETLPLADYIVSPEIAIERKRGDDLTASICDNRFFSQLTRLRQYYPTPIIILESPNRMFNQNVFDGSIYGAIMYVLHKLDCAIIPTQNAEMSALTITTIAKYTQQQLKKTNHTKLTCSHFCLF